MLRKPKRSGGMSCEEDEDDILLIRRSRTNRKRRVIESVDREEVDLPINVGIADSSSRSPSMSLSSEAVGKRRRSTPESVPEKKKKKIGEHRHQCGIV